MHPGATFDREGLNVALEQYVTCNKTLCKYIPLLQLFTVSSVINIWYIMFESVNILSGEPKKLSVNIHKR